MKEAQAILLKTWRSQTSWSIRRSRSKSCQRWFMTTMPLVLKTSGLLGRTGMRSRGFCELFCLSILMLLLVPVGKKDATWLLSTDYFCPLFYRFRPRILIDVRRIDMTTTVLGFKISMPIMIAPTAMQKMAHPDGIYWLVSCLSWVFSFLVSMWLNAVWC